MVGGNSRTRETAEIAVQGIVDRSLSFFLTVHTNDAVGAITRMRDMKIEPFLLASTLRAVIAQRLVRKLCEHCRKPVQARGILVASLLGLDPGAIVYEPWLAASIAANTGFKGRIGVFEAVRIDETIRQPGSTMAGTRRSSLATLFVSTRRTSRRGRAPAGQGRADHALEEAVRISRSHRSGRRTDRPMADFDYLAIDTRRPREEGAYRGGCRSTMRARCSTGSMNVSSSVVRIERGTTAAKPYASAADFRLDRQEPDERQGADAVHPPARHPQPRLAARGIAAHHHASDRAATRCAAMVETVHSGVIEGSPSVWSRWGASRKAFRRSTARWSRQARARALCRRSSIGWRSCSSGRRKCARRNHHHACLSDGAGSWSRYRWSRR